MTETIIKARYIRLTITYKNSFYVEYNYLRYIYIYVAALFWLFAPLLQVEAAVYNEREKCYDEMCNLFRRFQDTNKRDDLRGSKMESFWLSFPDQCEKVFRFVLAFERLTFLIAIGLESQGLQLLLVRGPVQEYGPSLRFKFYCSGRWF